MKKTVLPWLIFVLLFLAACSSSANTAGEEGVILPVTADLPQNRKVKGLKLNVPTREDDPIQHEYGFLLAEEWKKLGLDVNVVPLEKESLSRLAGREEEFDFLTGSWNGQADSVDPDFFIYRTLHSESSGLHGFNKTGYSNPNYDALALEQRMTFIQSERKEIIHDAEKLFLEDLPYAPILHRDLLMVYNDGKFSNFQFGNGHGLSSFWTFMDLRPKGLNKYVRWAYPSDIDSLNPLAASNSQDYEVTRLIYDTLVKINRSGEPENWAAKSVEDVNGDGKTYLITLRDGMKFHDGEKVTAEDVQFSFHFASQVETAAFAGLVENVKKVEVVDELSVQITLKEVYAPFVNQTLAQLFIFPQHYWEPILTKEGPEGVIESKNEKAIGSGPFQLDYWEPGKELKLDANADHPFPPDINGVLRIIFENTKGMIAAVKNGQAEIAGVSLQPNDLEDISAAERLKIAQVPTNGLDYLLYNTRIKPFADQDFRKALTFAIPKEMIVEEVLEGAGKQAESLISPANTFWHSDDLKGYEYSLQKAVDQLMDAGYEWDDKGKLYYPAE